MIKLLFDKMIKFAVEIQYIHLHRGTDWAITWGMRCYFTFSLFRVKTCSKEETMIMLTCASRCSLAHSLVPSVHMSTEPKDQYQ